MCVIGDKKFEDQAENSQQEYSENRNSIDLTYKQNFSVLNFNDLKKSVLEESSLSLTSQFLKCLALCHNLHQHKDEFIGFPEEIALVKSAASFGFVLNIPEDNIYAISKEGSNKDYYRIVASRPFNKEKQRLRILLEGSQASGILYVKGSADAILPLLDVDESLLRNIKENIELMSNSGLRTMIFAYKKISAEEVLETKSKIQRIKKSLLNPESRIEAMFKELEKNLKFLGIAGLSENLLPGVAETLNSIKEAGIKI